MPVPHLKPPKGFSSHSEKESEFHIRPTRTLHDLVLHCLLDQSQQSPPCHPCCSCVICSSLNMLKTPSLRALALLFLCWKHPSLLLLGLHSNVILLNNSSLKCSYLNHTSHHSSALLPCCMFLPVTCDHLLFLIYMLYNP